MRKVRTPQQQLADILYNMSYDDMRELAREWSRMAADRADPKTDLGGFKLKSRFDWAELLADWAESVSED